MIIFDATPGSPEHMAARLGIPTASMAHCILTSGGAPKVPQHYRLAEQYEMPSNRAKRQREIVGELSAAEMLKRPAQPLPEHEGSSALRALLDAGTVLACEPPEGTEPLRDPPRRSSQTREAVNRWVAEWVTGGADDEWRGTYWTERGQMLEPQARAYFELQTGYSVRDCAFIWRDEAKDCGCSPDGEVFIAHSPNWAETIGGLETKSPKLATHLRWLETPDEVPADHWLQVQFSLWVSRLPRWWFMSWAGWPCVPPLLVEVEPDEVTHRALDEVMPEVLEAIREKREWLLSCGVEPQAPVYVDEAAE